MLLGRPFLGPLCWYPLSNASVTSNHGPVRFLSSIRVLARKAEWKACGNLHRCCSFWPHQATGLVRLDTAVHLCLDQINRRNPQGPVWCPYGRRAGPARESAKIFISCETHTGPVRDGTRTGPMLECRMAPSMTRMRFDTIKNGKTLTRASYVALRGPYSPL